MFLFLNGKTEGEKLLQLQKRWTNVKITFVENIEITKEMSAE